MKILLAANAMYEPPRGGATRSNLAWLRELTRAGHECRVVSPSSVGNDDIVTRDGIAIHRVHDLTNRTPRLTEEIHSFQPDFVLVSSEDLSHSLLREVNNSVPGRLIYIAHTPQFFPFGPESWNPDKWASGIIRHARAVIAIGHHMAGYIHQHLDRVADIVHPPIYGQPPYPAFGSFDAGYVLMINPCAVKGSEIFLELARRFPNVEFAALAGWATTSADRAAMDAIPNIRVLESVPNIDDVLRGARVLLMPSIWYEGFGLIVMEAMLRGLPVIASDSGGLKEAKGSTGYVIPVQPVERYELNFDEVHMPHPVFGDQDIDSWAVALERLLSDRGAYKRESERSRQTAFEFVSNIDPRGLEKLLLRLKHAPMRILLAQNSLYYPSHGGGDKSNRLLMEALAARGHAVRVCARIETFGAEAHETLKQDLMQRGLPARDIEPGALAINLNNVDVRTLTRSSLWRAFFAQQIVEFDPDIILTSTDDPAQLLLDQALGASRARVVYLIRAPIGTSFGPHSSAQHPERTEKLRQVDGIVAVSEWVAQYAREHGKLDAVYVPISLLENREFARLGQSDNRYVTMVNPCAVKGIDIFLQLARQNPNVPFAAIPMWGTNEGDLARLQSLPNIDILPARDNVDEIFAQTRILLVPSVWAEARSRVVVEAMARGIPVMASDIGGLPEAKLGIPYLLPIHSIEHYRTALDEKMVPVADVPAQDIGPWQEALDRLTSDATHWGEIADASHRAARDYLDSLSVEPFENFLRDALAKPKNSAVDHGSAERQRLLALRVRQLVRQRRSLWFPAAKSLAKGQTRLFAFPFAGAGAFSWTGWQEALGPEFAFTPVRLPGRESRSDETPFEDLHASVQALAREIEPLLVHPFIFYGHSMGGAIAFELVRELRRRGLQLPELLAVSGARAPQFRLNHVPLPDPSDAELLDQMPSVPGIERSLPVLRADTRLFRRYVYFPAPPLDIPIIAFGGESDPNVSSEHLEAWREQTAKHFSIEMFPGGHFFIRSNEFIAALRESLLGIVSP